MLSIHPEYGRSHSLRLTEEQGDFLHLELLHQYLVIATGEGPRPKPRTGLCEPHWTVFILRTLVCPVFIKLLFKELILISRIGLNVRLQPEIWSFHLFFRHLSPEHVSVSLKAGVATEIKKLKVKW